VTPFRPTTLKDPTASAADAEPLTPLRKLSALRPFPPGSGSGRWSMKSHPSAGHAPLGGRPNPLSGNSLTYLLRAGQAKAADRCHGVTSVVCVSMGETGASTWSLSGVRVAEGEANGGHGAPVAAGGRHPTTCA